jgi:hypothetical protein
MGVLRQAGNRVQGCASARKVFCEGAGQIADYGRTRCEAWVIYFNRELAGLRERE